MSTQQILEALSAPFTFGEEVSVRVGPTNEKSRNESQPLRGQPLYYIDARVVMDRLDAVCGVEAWMCNYTAGVGSSIVCNIAVRFPVLLAGNQIGHEWVWKGDGAGPSDMEAEKGALSDAFKRAAVRWGIGRYLYDLKAPWFELETRGRTSFIRESDMPRLAQIHDELARKVPWGDLAGGPIYRLLLAEIKTLAPASAETFLKEHDTTIKQFPPAMRAHLIKQIEGLRHAG
jgi:hypothetical protein